MKRKLSFLITLLLLVSLMTLSAASIEVTGFGITPEAAEEEAFAALARRIRVSVSSVTSSKTVATEASASSVVEDSIDLESDIEGLIGVVISSAVEKNGGYQVQASIPESAIGLYSSEIKRIVSRLYTFNAGVDGDADARSRVLYLNDMYKLRNTYEAYRTILSILDMNAFDSLRIDESQIPSADSILNALRMEYTANINSFMMETLTLKAESEMEGADVSVEDAYRKASAAYEASIRYLKEIEEEQKRQAKVAKENLSSEIASYIEELDRKVVRKAGQDGSVDPSVLISVIEGSYRSPYKIAKDELKTNLNSRFDEFSKDATLYSNSIYGRPYQVVELDPLTGMPNVLSLESRVVEVEKGITDRFTVAYRSALDIYNAMSVKLDAYRSNASKEIAELGKNRVEISTIENPDSITAEIDPRGFDMKHGIWNGTVKFPFGDAVLSHPFKISYESWTGNKVPAINDIDAYNKYRLDCERLNSIFRSASNAVEVRLSYRIEGSLESNIYKLFVDCIEVWNPLKGSKVSYENPDTVYELAIGHCDENMADSSIDNPFFIKSSSKGYVAPDPADIAKVIAREEATASDKKQGNEITVINEVVVEKTIIKRNSKTLSVDIGVGTLFEKDVSRNRIPLSIGITKMTSKPMFGNTRFAFSFDIGADLDFLDLINGMIGCDMDLRFVSQVGSALGIGYGIRLGVDSAYTDLEHISLTTLGTVGLTIESFDMLDSIMRLDAFCGIRLFAGQWIPLATGGLVFTFGFLLN